MPLAKEQKESLKELKADLWRYRDLDFRSDEVFERLLEILLREPDAV